MAQEEHYRSLIDILSGKDRILITTHKNPDADGLGAEVALYHYLRFLNKEVYICNQEPAPANLSFLDPSEVVRSLKEKPEGPPGQDFFVVSVDNSDVKRMGDVARYVNEDLSNLVVIDHHDNSRPDYKTYFQFPEKGSSCEIIYEILRVANFSVDLPVAMALYTGIVSDTGSFRFKKTKPQTHRIAAELLEQGIHAEEVSEALFFNSPLGKLKIRQILYSRLETDDSHRIAWFKISYTDIEPRGLSFEDMEGIVNELIEPMSVRVGIIFAEKEPSVTKVSIRSKGKLSMVETVEPYGGGGHKNACGATLQKGLDEAIAEFLPVVKKQLQLLEARGIT